MVFKKKGGYCTAVVRDKGESAAGRGAWGVAPPISHLFSLAWSLAWIVTKGVRFAEALAIVMAMIGLTSCLGLAAPEPETERQATEVATAEVQRFHGPRSFLLSDRIEVAEGLTYPEKLEQGYRDWLAAKPTIDPLPESFLRGARQAAADGLTYPEQVEQGYRAWLASEPTIDPLPESFLWTIRNNPNDN